MILILGGTHEAHLLAQELQAKDLNFIVSLAGVTRNPPPRDYPTRSGGFGGAKGLAGYLTAKNITALIDMTHPYAAKISTSAVWACAQTGIPLIRYDRPAWIAPKDADWRAVATHSDGAGALPSGARAFLTVGSGGLAPFAGRGDVWFLYRAIEKPAVAFARGTEVLQRPPFSLEDELALMAHHKITHLVTKNAGGTKTFAKIKAATRLAIPIIVVERPDLPVIEVATSIPDVLKWLRNPGKRIL
ncbi:MAG: cobalt-precorrin-6A reductase [Paracoccaceae bacterium]